MNKILTTLFALFTLSTLSAQIQEQTVEKTLPYPKKKYTIATHPLYWFNSGMRFDFEMRIKDTPAWIQIGAIGYLVPRTDREYNRWVMISGDEFNHLLGGGLELNYKRFFNKKESWYFAGGCSYSRYNIDYIDKYWYSYIEDGLEYHTSKFGLLTQKIDKIGISTFLGYQKPKPAFLFDVFVGLGYRYSFKGDDTAKPFDGSMISLGYKGVVFITGVRFGVKFKQ
jgi:opacity protein-like surface antigen